MTGPRARARTGPRPPDGNGLFRWCRRHRGAKRPGRGLVQGPVLRPCRDGGGVHASRYHGSGPVYAALTSLGLVGAAVGCPVPATSCQSGWPFMLHANSQTMPR